MTIALLAIAIITVLVDVAFIAFIDWWDTTSIVVTSMILTLAVFIMIILSLLV